MTFATSAKKPRRLRRSSRHRPASRLLAPASSLLASAWGGLGAASRRGALLAGASVVVLALVAHEAAVARDMGRPAGAPAPSLAIDAAAAAAQQAAGIARQSQNSLTRATQAIRAIQATQDAARAAAAAAAAATPIADGLNAGGGGRLPGLVVDPRVDFNNLGANNLWVNAGRPTETTGNGRTTVTIQQTAQRAVMTWQSFNVSPATTVHFDQSGGNSANGNNWVALNRIDASGVPSQIRGQITAEGTVLIINPNGIVFGAGAQINVHSLIAAAMDLNGFIAAANGAFKSAGAAYVPVTVDGVALTTAGGGAVLAPSDEDNANKIFLGNGLFINESVRLEAFSTGNSALFSAASVPGQTNQGVRVEAGASIATNVSGFDNGGYVALIGPQVSNAGSVATSAGEIILAAGSSVQIAEPLSGSTQTSYIVRTNLSGDSLVYAPPVVAGGAHVANEASGLLVSSRGNITLFGDTVAQLGAAEATTSITRAGSITIAATGTPSTADPLLGAALFGEGSVTTILPEHNGETIPSDAESLANFKAPRIDVSAYNVDFGRDSLVLAPGAEMVVTGQGQDTSSGSPLSRGRVLLEAGSVIDLSGLTVTRSVADYLYTFKVTANDVADSPLAQGLIGKTVTIDLSLSGTRADGLAWVGSPLFSSSGAGYLANVTQGIDQLLTRGGSLSFGAGSISVGNGRAPGAFQEVLQAPGSTVSLSGGWIEFAGAAMNTTRLVGSDGRFHDIGSADPFLSYAIAGSFTVEHSRWGVSETYVTAMLNGSHYKPGYIDGLSAGSLAVRAATPILEGSLVGDIVIGSKQRQSAKKGSGTGGAQATPNELPNGATLNITIAQSSVGGNAAVVLASSAANLIGADFALGSTLPALPSSRFGAPVISYSTDQLSAIGLGSITIRGADTLEMAQGASLSVLAGGSINLSGATTIDGALIAHGGKIVVDGWRPGPGNTPNVGAALTLGSHALLDVSGQWINDSGLYGAAAQGALYVDGGSITLTSGVTSQQIERVQPSGRISARDETTGVVTAEDRSLSIHLAAGSVVDVSSGGYVRSNGRLKLGSDGLPVGKGGNLSLLAYADGWTASTGVSSSGHDSLINTYAPQTATAANIIMDGAIYAGGLSQGGALTLQAPIIVIDEQASAVAAITSGDRAGTLVLPPSFFTDSGFSSYTLTSVYGGVSVAAGTTLSLTQKNYLAPAELPGSGARVRDFASLGMLPDGVRHAVDLTLRQAGYIYGVAGDASATAKLLIGEGARIIGDPLAEISLRAGGPAVVLGDISAPGGSIEIQQGLVTSVNSTGVQMHDGLPQYIWIGENATLDVSGVFVPDPRVTRYATGSALAGGSISLSSSGVIVAEAGSVFDISGAAGTVQTPQGGLGGPRFATRELWSNGGSLTISGSLGGAFFGSAYFDGSIVAHGGAPQAAGGTVSFAAVSIVVAQSGDVAAPFANGGPPTTRAGLTALLPTTASTIFVTADALDSAATGIDSLSLTGALYFSGDVHLGLPGALYLNAGIASRPGVTLLPTGVTDTAYSVPACAPAGSCIPSIGGAQVTLEAGYIRLLGNNTASPTLADGVLTLKAARQIDLGGLITIGNAGDVNLVSGGDIRFLNPSRPGLGVDLSTLDPNIPTDGTRTGVGLGGAQARGGLFVADNLGLTARTIYPETETAFLLMSLGLAPTSAAGAHGVISFASNGQTPVAPLSAGGAIYVDARTISQGGALMAPLGAIQLGYGSAQSLPRAFSSSLSPWMTRVVTDSVTLLPGSLTSVTADGLSIPYGSTTDGAEWSVYAKTLNGPPSKLIALNGVSVDTQAGAVIDGRGGGDVYAIEFVPGTGGSRNVLADAANVYALVPGYDAATAPFDPSFGSTVPLGLTVTLPGGNGVPAGTYTLLPAKYATLPGAYRVVVVSSGVAQQPISTVAPDGSIYMTGTLGSSINGSRSALTSLLQIQPKSTWSRYSEIDIVQGDSYFAALAASTDAVTPRLARDAAQLSVAAVGALSLDATNLFAPAAGGRGGLLDISGTNLLIAASDLRAGLLSSRDYSGYLVLDSDMLSRLGIESVLIGGTRTTSSEGTLITATALNLEVATDAEHPLTAPELLLVSLAPTAASADKRGLVVDEGSVVVAAGEVAPGSDTPLIIGVDPVGTTVGGVLSYTPGVSGDGALLRVSNGGLVSVTRRFVPGLYTPPATDPAPAPPVSPAPLGSLAIGGATLSGRSLTLDSSGSSTVAGTANLLAKNYDLSGSIVNLGGGSGGLVVSSDLIGKFAGADVVRLRSASVFNLHGSNAIGSADNRIGALTFDGAGLYSDGGATAIVATDIAFINSQATPNLAGADTSGAGGALTLDAGGTIRFGAGAKIFSGFASVAATAAGEIAFTGSGSLDAKSANVTLTAPAVMAAAGAKQSLTTTGGLALLQGAGAAPALAATEIGGALSLTGGGVFVNGALIAQGGRLSLEAKTGDLILAAGAVVRAAGTRITLFDITQDTPGGAVGLIADAGNVTIAAGATVDVSSAGRGYAGSLTIGAKGVATLDGTLMGAAAYDDLGGEFTLVAGAMSGGLPLSAGFTRSFSVSLGAGDIRIGSTETLTSANVLLVANQGSVYVDGKIDASSASGGTIGLYGAGTGVAAAGTAGESGVIIGAGARLYARYRAADPDSPAYANGQSTLVQRGGTITLGTTGTPDGNLNPTYGYQNLPGSGAISVAAGAVFDISGGPGGVDIDNTGGSVIVRAPILSNDNINVSFKGTIVTNAKADGTASGEGLVVNAFAVWSTTDVSTDPDKHFDGIIDPAGFFDASGTRLISADANGLYPSSTAASPAAGAYTKHVNFYQTTLLNFVNAPFDTAAVAANFAEAKLKIGENGAETALPASSLHLRPEIDLVNPPTGVNNGDIRVVSNWNFGAGSIDTNGAVNLLYRTTNGAEPGSLVLRAANNVRIEATISDGFFADYEPGAAAADAAQQYGNETASSLYQSYLAMFSNGVLQFDSSGLADLIALNPTLQTRNPPLPSASVVGASAAFFNTTEEIFNSLQFELQAPTIIAGSAEVIDQYNQYYDQYVTMFRAYATDIVALNSNALLGIGSGTIAPNQTSGPALLSYSDYVAYITAATRTSSTALNFINPLRSSYLPLFAPPTAATTSSPYYDIANGLGDIAFNTIGGTRKYLTSASDYASRWTAYFFTVANANINNTRGQTLGAALNNKFGSGTKPTLDNVAGLAAQYGVYGAIAATPPYAPPAYTSLQPGYVSSIPAPSPADQIANNPGTLSSASGPVVVYNATSSADLMTAARSGKGSFSYNFVGGALFNASGASSVDPNAVISVGSLNSTLTGNVTVDGHTSYINPFTTGGSGGTANLTVHVPTLVRTGTGSITITAAGDFALLDEVAPGAVYTAGYVAENAAGFTAPTLPTLPITETSNGLITKPVWARGGGDIVVRAGRDIIGIETPSDPDGSQFWSVGDLSKGVSTGQFWSAWYYVNGKSTGAAVAPFDPSQGGEQYSAWINYGTFFQGFGALGGGDVTLAAGRDVKDVSASLPETIQVSGGQSASGPAAAAHYYGGGNLLVQAGRDVLSGVYYVGRGAGLIRAGGEVVSDATVHSTAFSSISGNDVPIATSANQSAPLLLAVQDGFISVQATGSITLGGIFQPTRIPFELVKNRTGSVNGLPVNIGATFDSYAESSGVSLSSSIGSVAVSTGEYETLFTHLRPFFGTTVSANLISPTLQVAAFTGDISIGSSNLVLYPSATGGLSLTAGGSVLGALPSGNRPQTASLDMRDTGIVDGFGNDLRPLLGSPFPELSAPLHEGDDEPVIIYAGKDISGRYSLLKSARLRAGRDITDVIFTGMNVADSDITSIIAGRDIAAKLVIGRDGSVSEAVSAFVLYGPGALLMEAGRDLGPFNTGGKSGGGIVAIGDGSNSGGVFDALITTPTKTYLPVEGADITLLFGIAPGVDYDAAIARYVDPAKAGADGISLLAHIAATLETSEAEAWAEFQASSPERRKLLVDRAFLDFLTQVSRDFNNPSSPYSGKYGRAYQAIATLFPAALGYTDNSAGGSGATPVSKHTGDLRMARSLIETQTKGDIDLIGPGGSIFVGANAADALLPSQQGILTLAGGSIRSYTDGSVLIFQSRIFTQQGGDIGLFSANGDLNAGKGPKSSAAFPPLLLVCDANGYCKVSPAGLVTGAGVGALLTVPGQDPTKSNVTLTAPHGTVDAGAAGVRVAGNLNIVAARVNNAFNIQAQGSVAGLPTAASAPNVGALTTASNAAGAAARVADAPRAGSGNSDAPSLITVEVMGYGGGEGPSGGGASTRPNAPSDGTIGSRPTSPRSRERSEGEER